MSTIDQATFVEHFTEDLPEKRSLMWSDASTPAASWDETQSDDALFVLKERYLVQQFMARGGMAMVYRGQDLQSHRTVARNPSVSRS